MEATLSFSHTTELQIRLCGMTCGQLSASNSIHIRYDRRGYGRSPATTKPYYEADDLATTCLVPASVTHAVLVASLAWW